MVAFLMHAADPGGFAATSRVTQHRGEPDLQTKSFPVVSKAALSAVVLEVADRHLRRFPRQPQ